jgi:hypothetical protein
MQITIFTNVYRSHSQPRSGTKQPVAALPLIGVPVARFSKANPN